MKIPSVGAPWVGGTRPLKQDNRAFAASMYHAHVTRSTVRRFVVREPTIAGRTPTSDRDDLSAREVDGDRR